MVLCNHSIPGDVNPTKKKKKKKKLPAELWGIVPTITQSHVKCSTKNW